jgi:hypothetical protein
MKQNTFQGVLLVLIFAILVYISILLKANNARPTPPGYNPNDTTTSDASRDKPTGPKFHTYTMEFTIGDSSQGNGGDRQQQKYVLLPLAKGTTDTTHGGGSGPKLSGKVVLKEVFSNVIDPNK